MSEPKPDTHQPQPGFNVKKFLIAIIVAGVIICVAAMIYIKAAGPKDLPKTADPHPTSRLVLPAQDARAA